MKKFVVVLFVAAFAFVCLAMSGCEDKNASKRKAEFVSGGAESIQPKALTEFMMRKASADQAQNRMLPLCGGVPALPVGRPATIGKGMKNNNSSPPQNRKNGAGKTEVFKIKGSL